MNQNYSLFACAAGAVQRPGTAQHIILLYLYGYRTAYYLILSIYDETRTGTGTRRQVATAPTRISGVTS